VVAETFQVTRLLGRGGMGSVWEASHLRLPGKKVAIKVLHADVAADQEALARFRREAEIATRLGHPNIVEVHDFNSLPGGKPYLVLELLIGESLDSRLRRAPVSLDDAMRIAGQIGAALAAAHRQEVIHRDLKPQNVFLVRPRADETDASAGEIVKVLDFGISKIRGSQTVKTLDSTILGTPQYMSPEQATGNHAAVDARTDIFALGSIVYEMLAGRPAFTGQSIPEVVFKVVYEEPTPLADLVPGLPPRVAEAVGRALAKKQEDRFPDVVSFVEQMAGVSLSTLRRSPISLSPPRIDSTMTSGATLPPTPVGIARVDTADALAHTVDSGRRDRAALAPASVKLVPMDDSVDGPRSHAPLPHAPLPHAPIAHGPIPHDPIAHGPALVAPRPPTSPPRRRWAWLVGTLVLLAGGSGAALLVARSSGGADGPATHATGPAAGEPRPAATAAAPGEAASAAAPAATTATPAAPAEAASTEAASAEAASTEAKPAEVTPGGPGAEVIAAAPSEEPSAASGKASGPGERRGGSGGSGSADQAPTTDSGTARPARQRPRNVSSLRPDQARDGDDGEDGETVGATRGELRAVLAEGQAALRDGDYRRALVLAERALRHGAGAAAHALRASASCGIGDLGNAKASFLRIPRRHHLLRRGVLGFCTKNGVDLDP
jgi:serine/threonine protein kinase